MAKIMIIKGGHTKKSNETNEANAANSSTHSGTESFCSEERECIKKRRTSAENSLLILLSNNRWLTCSKETTFTFSGAHTRNPTDHILSQLAGRWWTQQKAHRGPLSCFSPPQTLSPSLAGGPGVFPWGAPELWVLVLPLGLYRLPTESISLEQTMGGIYPLGDRADPLNSLP